MSLLAAYAFGNMTVFEGDISKEPPGFTQFLDSVSPFYPGLHGGVVQRKLNPDNLSGYSYFRLPVFRTENGLPLPPEVDRFVFGYRLKNFVSDSSMRPYRAIVPSSSGTMQLMDPGIAFASIGFPNGVRIEEVYIEVEVDLVTRSANIYCNGKHLHLHSIATSLIDRIKQFGFIGLDIPAREYSPITRDPSMCPAISDIYVLRGDGIYPSSRLGSVTISDLPVSVSGSAGFDKPAVELEAVANQGLWASPTVAFTTNCQVAKLNDAAGEVDFSVPVAPEKVPHCIAVGIRVGAKRTGTPPVSVNLEVDRSGQKTTIPSVDLVNIGSERMHFSRPVVCKDNPEAPAADINDISFKLKVTGA